MKRARRRIRLPSNHGRRRVNPRPLAGKVALVTGASRGIGAAAAIRLAQGGAAVVVNYHQNKDAAQKILAEVESAGDPRHDCFRPT